MAWVAHSSGRGGVGRAWGTSTNCQTTYSNHRRRGGLAVLTGVDDGVVFLGINPSLDG